MNQFKLLILISVIFSSSLFSLPERLGDLDEDGEATVSDIAILSNHISEKELLPPELERFGDVNQDGTIDTADVDLIADAVIGEIELPIPPATPTVSAPDSTSDDSIMLIGSASPGTSIRIEGGAEPVNITVNDNGIYETNVDLQSNRLNRLFITATDGNGIDSATKTISVVQDSQRPSLFIDFPGHQSELTNTSVVVVGRVGDILSGYLGLRVKVVNTTVENISEGFEDGNPQLANVIVGIGTNGTFERGNVPLVEGENIIQAIAVDIHGNMEMKEVTVIQTPIPENSPRMTVLSGDLQQGVVNNQLEEPILVQVLKNDGSAFANKLVTFDVVRSNGRLSTSKDSPESGDMMLQLFTDSQGLAEAWWTMGSDAGCGNNRVEITSRDIAGTIMFCASADPEPARQINIGSGNSQRAEAGGPAPEPLRVWVNDTCNGVPNVPVTFTVIEGGGTIQGLNTFTANTGITGHAEVNFTLGPNRGNNVIEANFAGHSGASATFVIFGITRTETSNTSFTGLVLDNSSQPIEDAECILEVGGMTYTTMSEADGQFVFESILSGPGHLTINGTTAIAVGGETIDPEKLSFPVLGYEILIVPEAENSLPTSVLLPPLNPLNTFTFDGTKDVILTVDGIEGLQMTVTADTVVTLPDGTVADPANPVELSLNQVHHDDIPMPMPDGIAPPLAWTLQPAGTTFDPPVEVVYPNMSGLPPGAVGYFLSFNHDTNRFDIVASGHVTNDGLSMISDPDSGISTAGWGCNCPPYPPQGDCKNDKKKEKGPQCQKDNANIDPVYLFSGEFYEEFEDLRIKGRGFDFVWTRKYRSQIGPDTEQGNGWDYSYNLFLEQSRDDIIVCDGNTRADRFSPLAEGSWTRVELFRQLDRLQDGFVCFELSGPNRKSLSSLRGLAAGRKNQPYYRPQQQSNGLSIR